MSRCAGWFCLRAGRLFYAYPLTLLPSHRHTVTLSYCSKADRGHESPGFISFLAVAGKQVIVTERAHACDVDVVRDQAALLQDMGVGLPEVEEEFVVLGYKKSLGMGPEL